MAKSTEDNLDPNFKKAWLKALRSGDFRQCRDALEESELNADGNRSTSYCCLGVLKEVASHVRENGDGGLTPGSSGISEDTQQKLIHMNDINGWSFKRIATWIEKHL